MDEDAAKPMGTTVIIILMLILVALFLLAYSKIVGKL